MSMPPDYNYFKYYPNPYYVETGCYNGDSIDLALQSGFTDIRAVEIDPVKVEHCRQRFEGQPVSIFEGDSAEILWDVIKEIPGQITFWLDSHWQMFHGTEPGKHPWPLLHELAQIMKHPVKTHTIIIDDILVLTHPDVTCWSLEKIKAHLKLINPAYKFELVPNPVINNILIATV